MDWAVADVTDWSPQRKYDVWHDRAVFHFLTEQDQRVAYRRVLLQGLKAGGLLIIATFALDDPERCSGLLVERYDAAKLANASGQSFYLLDSWQDQQETPRGSQQSFNWCAFRSADSMYRIRAGARTRCAGLAFVVR